MKGKLEKIFKLKENNTNIKIEFIAGLTTFLAVMYILTVNPNNILIEGSSDPKFSSVFLATALGSAIGTLFMALFANMPFVEAPGMGLNSTIGAILGGSLGFAFTYSNVMSIVFLSGILFIMLSFIKIKGVSIREKIFGGIPKVIITAIPVGIGLFIAFIGLKNAGIIEHSPFTLLKLTDFTDFSQYTAGGNVSKALVCLFGLLLITILSHYKVKGSVIIGILGSTLLAIPLNVADISILLGKVDGISWKFWENFSTYFSMDPDNGGIFMSIIKGGFVFPKGSIMTIIMIIVTFLIIDLFDSMGTIVGCTESANLLDEDGKPKNYSESMMADSLSTPIGAMLGTSTVTTYVESSVGVAIGGRTGLTALFISIFFLLSIFILPVFAFIPIASSSAALIYVGSLMINSIKKVDFSSIRNAIPNFLTIILMPLTYSITDGIGLGIITYVIIDLIIYIIDKIKGDKKAKLNINLITIIVAILFIIYFLMPKI